MMEEFREQNVLRGFLLLDVAETIAFAWQGKLVLGRKDVGMDHHDVCSYDVVSCEICERTVDKRIVNAKVEG